MKVKSYAKLNLTLNVFGKQNGFHNIDSIATSVDIYDVVEVNKRNDKQVTVAGLSGISDEQNTAYKAAYAFIQRFGVFGVDIVIDKRIPFGAGMGGSSADAAAVVYCMCKLFGIDVNSDKVKDVCACVGSDVVFMLYGGLGRMQGKGDDIVFYSDNSPMYFAVTEFAEQMSSGKVYAAFDELTSPVSYADNDTVVDMLLSGNGSAPLSFGNCLSEAAASLSSYADGYLAFCNANNIRVNMTGSGSAYYFATVYKAEADRVFKLLNSHGFKTFVCKTVSCGVEEI